MDTLERLRSHLKGKTPEELRAEFLSISNGEAEQGISIKVFLENNGYSFEQEEIIPKQEKDFYESFIKALLETELYFFNNYLYVFKRRSSV